MRVVSSGQAAAPTGAHNAGEVVEAEVVGNHVHLPSQRGTAPVGARCLSFGRSLLVLVAAAVLWFGNLAKSGADALRTSPATRKVSQGLKRSSLARVDATRTSAPAQRVDWPSLSLRPSRPSSPPRRWLSRRLCRAAAVE